MSGHENERNQCISKWNSGSEERLSRKMEVHIHASSCHNQGSLK